MPRKLTKRESQGMKKDEQIWHNKQIKDEDLTREKLIPLKKTRYEKRNFVILTKCLACEPERRQACIELQECIIENMKRLKNTSNDN